MTMNTLKIIPKFFLIALLLVASFASASAQSSSTRRIELTPTFSNFAKNYVETRINEWQKKGEFEKTSDYRKRISEERDKRIKMLTAEAREKYIESLRPTSLKEELSLGEYNADTEMFAIEHPKYGVMAVSVPISEAPSFKQNWLQMSAEGIYVIENDKIALASIEFKHARKKQTYTSFRGEIPISYDNDIAFNFAPIEIPSETTSAKQTNRRNQLTVSSFDTVDTDIPSVKKTSNAQTFAVIISNENYKRVSSVEYANNDGKVFEQYLKSTLGLPANHIHHVCDATLNDMRAELEWLQSVGRAYNGEASLIFYYSGHGIPDESTRAGYLLPVDGYGSNVSTGLAMADVNRILGDAPSLVTLVILDACFSGAMRDGEMLIAARGVRLKAKQHEVSNGNMVVLSASQEDETAAKYEEKRHGLFTYFLLKKIQEKKGDIDLGSLSDYVREEVNRQSIVTNNKSQTPTVLTSPDIAGSWSQINLLRMSK